MARNQPPTYFADRCFWYRDQQGYTLSDVEARVQRLLFGEDAPLLDSRTIKRGYCAEKIRRLEAGKIAETEADPVLLCALAEVYAIKLDELLTDQDVLERIAMATGAMCRALPHQTLARHVRSRKAA